MFLTLYALHFCMACVCALQFCMTRACGGGGGVCVCVCVCVCVRCAVLGARNRKFVVFRFGISE